MQAKNLFLFILFSSSLFSNYKFETVLSDLDDAWSLDFLNEETIIFTEMPGKLKIASLSDGSITDIKNVPNVLYSSQGGLSEVILDPNFSSNRTLYLSYSAKNTDGKATLFLMSAKLNNDVLEDKKVIFEAKAPRRVPVHIAAKIAFLKDGTILLSSGDGFDHREKA